MRALILDDEPMPAKHLQELIKQTCFEIKETMISNSPLDAMELLGKEDFDILFLDVEMPEMSGVEFLKRIQLPKNCSIIFTTAYSEYAVEAFQLNATHYLMKPAVEEELIKAVRKVSLGKMEAKKDDSKLSIYDGEEYLILDKNDIIRLEGDGSYTKVIMINRTILASKRMGYFEKKLNQDQFFRCHNSHVVNVNEIKKLGKSKSNYLVMSNEDVIPISSSKKGAIENILGL